MTRPENTEKKPAPSKIKKSSKKKPLAERMAGKKPFDWLKVDSAEAAAK